MKNLLLLILFTIISVKIFDGIYPLILSPEWTLRASERSIILRELAEPGSYFVTPNDKYIESTINLEKKKYKITVNDDGFVATKERLKNQDVDIIFFGGSSTEALYVEEKQRFPALVGELLSARLNREVYTLNAGVSGNNSLHSQLVLISKGLKYEPRFVVLMHNVNDWSLLSKSGSYFDAPNTRGIVISPKSLNYQIAKAVKDFLMPNSFNDFLTLIKSYSNTESNDEFYGYSRFAVELNEIKKSYKKSITSFIEVSRVWGIEPILLTQMSTMKRKNREYQDSFNEIIRSLGAKHNILVIDLDKELSDKEDFIYDMVHLNTEGSKKAASIITKSILKTYPEL